MKIALLMIVFLLSSCVQVESPALSAEEEVKTRIAGASTQNVIKILQEKPNWLFAGDVCPMDVMPKTEKKLEYKAAGCAGNPEECLEKCRADDGNACYALSLLLNEQKAKELPETQALYLRACKLGIMSGCTNYAADMLNKNPGVEKTEKCAADTFEKTCEFNDSWGCAMYGQVWALGAGRPQNTEEALKYFQKTCAIFGSESPACQSARKFEEILKQINQPDEKTVKSKSLEQI